MSSDRSGHLFGLAGGIHRFLRDSHDKDKNEDRENTGHQEAIHSQSPLRWRFVQKVSGSGTQRSCQNKRGPEQKGPVRIRPSKKYCEKGQSEQKDGRSAAIPVPIQTGHKIANGGSQRLGKRIAVQ